MTVTKVPCEPRETAISRDRWLVVVMVVVWCRYESYVCWDACEIDASQFAKIVETQVHSRRLRYWATVTGFALVPVTKVPYGPRETAISRDRWLVVVTVIVWCLLRILNVLRRVWNRRLLVRHVSGDTGSQQANPILSYCNWLCFGARYESSLWAKRNNHFTWPVASCGNGYCLMLVTNMSYQ
jgi:hypothetical protein